MICAWKLVYTARALELTQLPGRVDRLRSDAVAGWSPSLACIVFQPRRQIDDRRTPAPIMPAEGRHYAARGIAVYHYNVSELPTNAVFEIAAAAAADSGDVSFVVASAEFPLAPAFCIVSAAASRRCG